MLGKRASRIHAGNPEALISSPFHNPPQPHLLTRHNQIAINPTFPLKAKPINMLLSPTRQSFDSSYSDQKINGLGNIERNVRFTRVLLGIIWIEKAR